MVKTIQKRFIAGAVCARCKKIDKIRAWSTPEGRYFECVYCGRRDFLAVSLKQGDNLIPLVQRD